MGKNQVSQRDFQKRWPLMEGNVLLSRQLYKALTHSSITEFFSQQPSPKLQQYLPENKMPGASKISHSDDEYTRIMVFFQKSLNGSQNAMESRVCLKGSTQIIPLETDVCVGMITFVMHKYLLISLEVP